MYLPVAPDKRKHRRSLNLLEVPQPHRGPQVKQPKVETGDYFLLVWLKSNYSDVPWQPHSCADLHLPQDSQGNTDFAALVRQLKECPTLQDQADLLYILYVMKYGHDADSHGHWYSDIDSYNDVWYFCWAEEPIGWWSCRVQGRAESVFAACWRSCMCRLECAKSGDLSDTSLAYYARGWRS